MHQIATKLWLPFQRNFAGDAIGEILLFACVALGNIAQGDLPLAGGLANVVLAVPTSGDSESTATHFSQGPHQASLGCPGQGLHELGECSDLHCQLAALHEEVLSMSFHRGDIAFQSFGFGDPLQGQSGHWQCMLTLGKCTQQYLV